MSAEIFITTESAVTTEIFPDLWLQENQDVATPILDLMKTTKSVNISAIEGTPPIESQVTSSVFEAFIIIEIVMTASELLLSILAASKVAKWRKNYRNQMLMQLSLVRFIKRVYALIKFLVGNKCPLLISVFIYIDFVMVILVCFFIKHMYESLIVVLVKTNKNQLMKVIAYAWLLPVPISAIGTFLILSDTLEEWGVYLFICAVFRWPLMFIGSLIYITILMKVLLDKIRRFARSLTIITFVLCLVINLHLLTNDIIKLFCIDTFYTKFIAYTQGLIMNVLILFLYILLITLHLKRVQKPVDDLPNSEAMTKC